MKDFGKFIKERRLIKKLKATEVGLAIGRSEQQIWRFEAGTIPPPHVFEKMVRFFDIDYRIAAIYIADFVTRKRIAYEETQKSKYKAALERAVAK